MYNSRIIKSLLVIVMTALLLGACSSEEEAVTQILAESTEIPADNSTNNSSDTSADNLTDISADDSTETSADTSTDTSEAPVIVGLIDTGVSDKVIPVSSVLPGYNYVLDSYDTDDTYHHGTGSASIILELAPNALIVPLICTTYDSGYVTQVDAEGLADIILDAVDTFDCDIICAEVGVALEKGNTRLEEAVKYAADKGVLICAPVGNANQEKPDKVYYPAAYEEVLGVGAYDEANATVAEYSQRGSAVNLVAPGKKLVPLMSGTEDYEEGTSVSVAIVAGSAARLLCEHRDLTANELRNILFETAHDILDEGYDTDSGYGVLDLEAALEAAGNQNP